MLQVVPDGRLITYSADKGDKLLEVQTGLRGGMGPPITYLLDGKQYVSVMGGTGPVTNPFGGGAGENRGGANRGGANTGTTAPGTAGAAEPNTPGGNAPAGRPRASSCPPTDTGDT